MSWSQLLIVVMVFQVVVLASVVALVPEVNVFDKWGMLQSVVLCLCWYQVCKHIVLHVLALQYA